MGIWKIVRDQMGGIYDSKAWADLITAHLISGPSILDGTQEAWDSVNKEGGDLLAQMSSEGNLLELGYTDSVVKLENTSCLFWFYR